MPHYFFHLAFGDRLVADEEGVGGVRRGGSDYSRAVCCPVGGQSEAMGWLVPAGGRRKRSIPAPAHWPSCARNRGAQASGAIRRLEADPAGGKRPTSRFVAAQPTGWACWRTQRAPGARRAITRAQPPSPARAFIALCHEYAPAAACLPARRPRAARLCGVA